MNLDAAYQSVYGEGAPLSVLPVGGNPNILKINGVEYDVYNLLYPDGKATNKSDKSEIIGATDLSFYEVSQDTSGGNSASNALTQTVLDFTTYPDRALFSLTNGRGYDVYLTQCSIKGNPIMRYRGSAGQLLSDQLKRDDDIRRNGEVVKTISNDYIMDATQVATIADYWYKQSGQKRHLFSLTTKGTALCYEPGEWYRFQLGEAGTNEYIDSIVECYAVNVTRDAGGIGSTSLMFRECMEGWAKTTLYAARLVTGASPKRRTNQSNTLIVASSSFDGTYDYRCDGTADDVQIQAAIDYISATFSGGVVQLTSGTYVISDPIAMGANITLRGEGSATIIQNSDVNPTGYITTAQDCIIKDLSIDGQETEGTFTIIGINITADKNVAIDNVVIKNIWASTSMTGGYRVIGISADYDYVGPTIMNCIIDNLKHTGTEAPAAVAAIYGGGRCRNNRILNITASGASSLAVGLYGCNRCEGNIVGTLTGSTTFKYTDSYAGDGADLCANDAVGGYNS